MTVALVAQLPGEFTPDWLRPYGHAYQVVWPQRWYFFSNAPESEAVVAYRVNTARADMEPATWLHMSHENLWGLLRVADSQMVEAAYLARRIPAAQWSVCNGSPSRDCRHESLKQGVHALVNDFPRPTLCGVVVLAYERPKQWTPGGRYGADAREPARVSAQRLDCVR
ncbi:SdpA family antimicrobial peptide system protein [Planobispora takensis]|uniref:Uncharacterized protein n=1 Tax=Planobispora takensis TaxID=1367882 RepID=A0A8J3SRV9_9ACTN|nr:SdpA family antimicrobial peptide system protein [Planobispora takensis]GIH98204.1 hypothetical protein Pta02_02130 [Planobispora takensis]